MMAHLLALAVVGALQAAPPPAGRDVPADSSALAALRAFEGACRADAGRLWGVSLCGPVLLVDPGTRRAWSNVPVREAGFEPLADAFAGHVPADLLLANTVAEWQGRRWAMVLLPLPGSSQATLALLAHESFHRIQPQLGVPLRDPAAAHLAERDGRVWLRLELRALAAALSADGPAARRHVQEALQLRAARHAAFPGADTLEAALELSEGLAEYTGLVIALGDAAREHAADATRRFEGRPSFVRSLGYGTGPALALLLDRYAPGWRLRAGSVTSLSHELRRAVALPLGALDARAARGVADRWGYTAVAAAEDSLVAAREARRAAFRAALVDGPTLRLPMQSFSGTFDPNDVVPLDAGSVYPTGTFQSAWGTLEVRRGALVASDFSAATVAAADAALLAPLLEAAPDERTVETDAWTLRLAPGWYLAPADRPGSFVARR